MANVIVLNPQAPLSVTSDNDVDRLDDWVKQRENRRIFGLAIKFRDGLYYAGKEGVLVPIGTRRVISINHVCKGRIKWQGRKVVDAHVGRPMDNFQDPPREALGDLDESKWEIGPDGKPQDPWQGEVRMLLKAPGGRTVDTFVSSTIGGTIAVERLCKSFAMHRGLHPGMFPVVELQTCMMRTKFRTDKPRPMFPIVGWEPKSEFAAALEAFLVGDDDVDDGDGDAAGEDGGQQVIAHAVDHGDDCGPPPIDQGEVAAQIRDADRFAVDRDEVLW